MRASGWAGGRTERKKEREREYALRLEHIIKILLNSIRTCDISTHSRTQSAFIICYNSIVYVVSSNYTIMLECTQIHVCV